MWSITTRDAGAGEACSSCATGTRGWYHRPPSHHAVAHAAIPTAT
jgi:hypothetical protein